ncbi:MAG: T9SS type A sorting domain-containing protein [Prevotellaceae bacterium]|jgi:hypothetical protein|nr:T9SS type A sorting domain-containing protein [Prevotellaceae bacterium]
MKKITFSLILFCFVFSAIKSQNTVNFDYDNAGNCIIKYKTVVMQSPAHTPARNNSEGEEDNTQNTDSVQVEDILGDIKITLFPNPTKGILQIEFQNKDAETTAYYTLSELNGKHIFSGASASNPLLLNLSGYSTGAYLLRLKINNKTETYKIIKQ